MDGELYPKPAKNVELFGDWYKIRRNLFTEGIPMEYQGNDVPGIKINRGEFGIIGSINETDKIIHVINFKGDMKEFTLSFSNEYWENIEKIILEPNKKQLELKRKKNLIDVVIKGENVDIADTILRMIEL